MTEGHQHECIILSDEQNPPEFILFPGVTTIIGSCLDDCSLAAMRAAQLVGIHTEGKTGTLCDPEHVHNFGLTVLEEEDRVTEVNRRNATSCDGMLLINKLPPRTARKIPSMALPYSGQLGGISIDNVMRWLQQYRIERLMILGVVEQLDGATSFMQCLLLRLSGWNLARTAPRHVECECLLRNGDIVIRNVWDDYSSVLGWKAHHGQA